MTLEKAELKLLGFRPPVQMGCRPDVQVRLPSCGKAALMQIDDSAQVRVPPAPEQQHWLP